MKIKNRLLKYQNLLFFKILEKYLNDTDTVLDVGCGHSSVIGQINRKFKSEGIDIHRETLELSRKKKTHDKFKLGDVSKLASLYKENSFDACVSVDVIEHFTKKDSLKLIKDMEKIARKKVIILTPNGFLEQHDFEGNPHQVHKSGWSQKDLEDLGYKVYGLRGLKNLRDKNASIRFKPWIFWGFLAFLSEIVFFPVPALSFDLLAIKNLEKK